MRLFRSSPSRDPAFRLSSSLGEQKVKARITDAQVLICLKATGEAVEAHPLDQVSWHTCVLPNKEHALCLRVPESAPADGGSGTAKAMRELLLRSKARDSVDGLQAQLCSASLELERRRRQDGGHDVDRGRQLQLQDKPPSSGGTDSAPAAKRQLQLFLAASPPQSRELEAEQREGQEGKAESCETAPDAAAPCSFSFGSPVAEELEGAEASDSADSTGDRSRQASGAAGSACSSAVSSPKPRSGNGRATSAEADDWQAWQRHLPGSGTTLRPVLSAAPSVLPRSAPGSPYLPGLPLVAGPFAAGGPARHTSASAPVSPTHARPRASQAAASAAPEAPVLLPPALLAPQPLPPPVRLLSINGRRGREADVSHVQRLEAAVAQLSAELAQSRITGDSSQVVAAEHKPAADGGAGSLQQKQREDKGAKCCSESGPQILAQPAASAKPEPSTKYTSSADNATPPSTSQGLEAVLQENTLLMQQQALLQAELGRMQGQLAAAAADNIRLAQEAATAVRQLQAAGEASKSGQQREQELRACLAAAVGQCEGVGRELAALSGKLEAKTAQCQELRRSVDTLSEERTVLTAALTTAQLQLKEATPAGWAAQQAELRRQAEAAHEEAAAAKAAAAAADSRLAEALRREAEAAGHMREAARCMQAAQAGRATGLQREEQLAAEIRSLRQQLAGRLPEGDPSKALQDRVIQLEGACAGLQQERSVLVAQVQQLQGVGQDLSSSCRALEASMQAAVRDRDELKAALAQAHAERASAEQRWEQQRQQLEASLGSTSGRLAGSEDSVQSSRAQVQTLQAQVQGLQRDLQAAQQRSAAREQELQSELKLLVARAEAEAKAAKERGDAAAAAQASQAARQEEQLRGRDAELAAARREVGLLAAEQQRAQEEARRVKEEHSASVRELRLEASSARAEAAKLAQDLHSAQSGADQLRSEVEDARRAAQQAQFQVAVAVSAHTALSQERKELQGRLERLGVERDRAVRERDAQQLKCAALQQQCMLLEAVAQGQAVLGCGGGRQGARSRRGGSKENGGSGRLLLGGGEGLIKAHRQLACTTSSSSDC